VLVVGSDNALEALEVAWAVLVNGGSALDAVEAATRAVEDDPKVTTVGTGGYANLVGEVELDASVMEGTWRRAGAVAALGGYRHPVSIARAVMERLPHVLLAGPGAARFAAEIGAEPAELLTEPARQIWQRGLDRAATGPGGDRLLEQVKILTADPDRAVGTVDVLALDGGGHIASAVSTSGWAWKWPGRVGDSPLPGSGNYCDDRYGAAACTGFGELAIRGGTARSVVAGLAAGQSVRDAGRAALEDAWSLVGPRQDAILNVVVLDSQGRHGGLSTSPGGHYAWRDRSLGEALLAEREVVERPAGAG
jgi:beta-aspartyl-peptidase (threonine type)